MTETILYTNGLYQIQSEKVNKQPHDFDWVVTVATILFAVLECCWFITRDYSTVWAFGWTLFVTFFAIVVTILCAGVIHACSEGCGIYIRCVKRGDWFNQPRHVRSTSFQLTGNVDRDAAKVAAVVEEYKVVIDMLIHDEVCAATAKRMEAEKEQKRQKECCTMYRSVIDKARSKDTDDECKEC